uniref:Uncharacterized protein n=1 Tax=Anguilla anguilla TaxID=7936 RepID=A0A0E9WVX0_ANGAN
MQEEEIAQNLSVYSNNNKKKQTISVQISSGCRAELSSYSQLECSCARAASEMRPSQNYIIILSTVIGLRGQQ